MEPIQLTFTQTEKEYLAATKLFMFRAKGMFPRLVLAFALLSLLLVALMMLIGAELPLWFMFGIIMLVGAALYHRLLIDHPRRFFRGDPKFHDEYHVTFSDQGVACKTRQIDSKVAWSVYTGVIEGDELYILLYGKDSNMITLVPKRVFRSRDEEQQFRQLLERHIGGGWLTGRKPKQIETEAEYKPPVGGPPDWR